MDVGWKGFDMPLKACAYRKKGMVSLRHPVISVGSVVRFCLWLAGVVQRDSPRPVSEYREILVERSARRWPCVCF